MGCNCENSDSLIDSLKKMFGNIPSSVVNLIKGTSNTTETNNITIPGLDSVSGVAGSIASSVGGGISAVVKSVVAALSEHIQKSLAGFAIHSGNVATHSGDLSANKPHNIQDAKKAIKWHCMEMPWIHYVTKIKPRKKNECCSWTTSEHYPFVILNIDEQKNWEKWDLITGEHCKIHHTGNVELTDGDGNRWTKYVGNTMQYNFGEGYFFNADNYDSVYLKNKSLKIFEEHYVEVGKDEIYTIFQNLIKTILMAEMRNIGLGRMTTVGLNDVLKVGKDIKIKAGGNITIEAGGNITIKGAKIDLNP